MLMHWNDKTLVSLIELQYYVIRLDQVDLSAPAYTKILPPQLPLLCSKRDIPLLIYS